MKNSRMLIYSGNGYIFNEIYLPIINEMTHIWDIDLIISDFCLAEHTKKSVADLLDTKKIQSLKIIHAYNDNKNNIKHHFNLWKSLKEYKRVPYKLLILGSDFHVIDRYLIHYAKKNNTKIALVLSHTLAQILEKYLSAQGKLKKDPNYSFAFPRPNIKNFTQTPGIAKKIKKLAIIFKYIKMYWKIIADRILNQYVCPFIFTGSFFRNIEEDVLGFTSGRGDAVIVYDELEFKAMQKIVPKAKSVFIAQHPSVFFCHCEKNADQKNKKNILVLISGHCSKELEGEKINRISDTINRAIDFLGPNEIHLRFHPRTDKNLKWPRLVYNSLNHNACAIKIVESMDVELPSIICDYMGVIGVISGSLQIARAACKNIFVVALANCGDPMVNGDSWMLGGTKGIRIINDGEQLEREDLIPIQNSINKYPMAAQVLDTLVS
ncbi:MAG: hypothetical protein US74_C0013G0007 [Parcubacteria group bacterium GW2011_GWA2_38_13]|nr:MAG: hypothetical protein US74_C0013G0007 [Parcubacteria group bacterium GW2011_GWA2_38_13]